MQISETRAQPRPEIIDADFDHYLVAAHNNVGNIIEASRKFVWNKIVALEQEKRQRLEYADAYRRLYYQHSQTVAELNSMSSKNTSMNEQLDEASKALAIYKSAIQDYDQRLIGEHDASRQTFLEGRIRDLEREMAGMAQKQKESLSNAVDRINAAEHRINELNDEKSDLAKDYENSLKNVHDAFEAANQKIDELEKEKHSMAIALAISTDRADVTEENLDESECLPSASMRSNSVDTISSPANEKRARLEDDTRMTLEAPPKRGRRRR
jgi:chromosome segregation ATPase